MARLEAVAQFLDRYLKAERFIDEVETLFKPGKSEIRRLGLALEPSAHTVRWIHDQSLDALWLHRPWTLDPRTLPEGVAVLAHHLAFDERLTLGYNPRLADLLGFRSIEVLGYKENRPIGMIGEIDLAHFETVRKLLLETFGGLERVHTGQSERMTRIAIVGAMNRRLIQEASMRSVDLYITGQWRVHAEEALLKTSLSVMTLGHARSEHWGLKALGHILHERFSDLEVVNPDTPGS